MNAPFFPPSGTVVRELVIDSFAGGGGASTGIRMALGREPDIAINHDAFALAMHRVNHPATRHMLQDVATVDSVGMCAGLPIGMLWMSPDCTDHSKAKGAAPRRDEGRTTRGIGWAIVGWVKALPAWQRPRVVFLENVEEYVDWGPVREDGKRCPVRKGETFKAFCAAWKALGYGQIEWRQRRAWWSGSGTIRRRLYMIMRRDDQPIVWPERTHGDPGKPEDAARIAAGTLKPWVTAADCIDFALPMPSIFETRKEIKARLGINAIRPLADNTEARIAKGVQRHVLKVVRPFLVKVNHTARVGEARDRDPSMPLTALTGKRDDALVAPYLVPRYGERSGQEPRSVAVDRPGPTPVPTGNEGSLCAVSMMTMRNSGSPCSEASQPTRTLVADGAAETVLAAFIAQHSAGSHPGQPSKSLDDPLPTITAGGAPQGLVAAHMLTLRGSDRRDSGADAPVRTQSAKGTHDALVSLPLMTCYYGSDKVGGSVAEPLRTDTAKPRFGLVDTLAAVPPFGPQHEVRAREVAAFLRRHGCWDGGELVTLEVDGVELVLVDICMRMLTPRERYNANGFPRHYIIDHGIDEHGRVIPFSLEKQGHMCGNAVCPTEAAALVAANYVPREVSVPGRRPAQPSLFLEAAE